MKKKFALFFVIAFLLFPTSPLLAQPSRPVAEIERVAIISVDGLRPDLLLRADAPNMRRLMENGSFTFWAQTTARANTLPSHVSMLTGVEPEKHKITFNSDPPAGKEVYPEFPTIFELAKKAGYTTAMVGGKSKFSVLAKPGSLDWQSLPARGKKDDDAEGGKIAAEIIAAHRPQLFFVHFAGNDTVGHDEGWGSVEQIAGLARTDEAIGAVLEAIRTAGLADSTLIILTADHGGAGKDHGPDDIRSRTIPWVVMGPGVAKNYDLTLNSRLTVNVEDTFATACYFLGIEMGLVDGKPVLQVQSASGR